MRYWFVLLLIIFGMNSQAATKPVAVKIHNMQQQMQVMKKNIAQNKQHREQLMSQLQAIEMKIASVATTLHQLSQELDVANKNLTQLQLAHQQLTTKLNQQHDTLVKQIQSAYIISHESFLKILFNQENPRLLSRMLNYYRYFSLARLSLVTELKSTLTQVLNNEKILNEQLAKTKELIQSHNQEQLAMSQEEATRKQVLNQLNKEILSKTTLLQEIQVNKQHLEKVVNQLRVDNEQAFNKNYAYVNKTGMSFTKMQKKLPWPTVGKVVQSFSSHIGNSQLNLNGVVIGASKGQPVYAIYPGRVVFADWLRGFGLLLIIDHGDGYMTLYARNEALYSKQGDVVKAGDLITRVGNSGGYSQSGLYFSIRHNGKPIDPTKWCRNT